MKIKDIIIWTTVFILLLSTVSAYEVFYYHNDNLNSPVTITNLAGEVVWKTDYDPFGEAINEEGDNKLKYNAKEEDATGLLYYGARYYNPRTGRFITADTVKGETMDTQSQNKYAYTKNNPLKYVDPSGNQGEDLYGVATGYSSYNVFLLEGSNLFTEMKKNIPGLTWPGAEGFFTWLGEVETEEGLRYRPATYEEMKNGEAIKAYFHQNKYMTELLPNYEYSFTPPPPVRPDVPIEDETVGPAGNARVEIPELDKFSVWPTKTIYEYETIEIARRIVGSTTWVVRQETEYKTGTDIGGVFIPSPREATSVRTYREKNPHVSTSRFYKSSNQINLPSGKTSWWYSRKLEEAFSS